MVLLRLVVGVLFAVEAIALPLHRAELDATWLPPASAKVKVAFFDADWTLRTSLAGATTAVSADDVMILPFVAEKLRALTEAGYLIVIVSNQGWTPETLPYDTVERAMVETAALLEAEGAKVGYFDFAVAKSGREKPRDVMGKDLEARLAARGVAIDWENSFMVGDAAYEGPPVKSEPILYPKPGTRAVLYSNSDRRFAESLGVRFTPANEYFGWARYGIDTFVTAAEVAAFRRKYGCRAGFRALSIPTS